MSKANKEQGIAIITGASSGIGREFAYQLKDNPEISEFWLVARRKERLEKLAEELGKACRLFPVDLQSEASSAELFAALADEKPQIKYLVNSAGYGKIGAFHELSPEENLGQINLNIFAVVKLTQACLPFMLPKSSIFNIASVAAFLPQPEFSIYTASKAFILSWTRALAEEKFLREREIQLVAVCPNPVETEFFEVAAEGEEQASGIKSIGVEKVEDVVATALRRAKMKWNVSVSSPWAKLIHLNSKIFPTKLILWLERKLLKIYE